MLEKVDLEKIWQKVPPDYYQKGVAKNFLQRLWHKRKIETFARLIGKGNFSRILDVGCAGGMTTNEISKIFPESKIVGVDIYKEAVTYGRKIYPHIKFLVADAHNLPFDNNSFDLCICYETIEHVEEPQRVLSEIKRVTHKNGRAIIAMDSGSLLFRIVWWLWEKTKGKVWQGAHIHPFTHNELEKLIRKAGFKVKEKRFSHLGMEISFLLSK